MLIQCQSDWRLAANDKRKELSPNAHFGVRLSSMPRDPFMSLGFAFTRWYRGESRLRRNPLELA
jgi:hypothetical protein